MMQRSLWGAVYALAIFWICNGRPWSPYILSLPLLGVAWEFIQMSKLSVQQRGLGLAYTFLAGWSTYQIIDTWEDTSGFILFSAFLLIWLSDSMAYVGGRLVGRTPLAPLLSPKKRGKGPFRAPYSPCSLALHISSKWTVRFLRISNQVPGPAMRGFFP